MIDRAITCVQGYIIARSNKFIYRNTGPYSGEEGTRALGRLENRAVMALSVGITSLMDYVKFPLATIEELMKGILLTPTAPFSKNLAKCCGSHYCHALDYALLVPKKLFLGTVDDVKCLYTSLKAPHLIPAFYLPSYYGALLFVMHRFTPNQAKYPSIYLS
jgi:hypothetical protein